MMNIIHSSIISKKTENETSILKGFKNVLTTIPVTVMLMVTGFCSSWLSNYYFNESFGINLPLSTITLCFIFEHLFLFPNIYCDILSPGLKYWNETREQSRIQKSLNSVITSFNSFINKIGLEN